MEQGATPVTPVLIQGRDTDTTAHARLTGGWLLAARAVWVVLTVLTLTSFVLALPGAHRTMFAQAVLYADQLIPLRIGPAFFAYYLLSHDFLSVLIFDVVGFFLFWRRSDNWVTLLVSLMLIMFGTIITNGTVLASLDTSILLGQLNVILFGIGHALFIIFLLIFPDGKFIPKWTLPASIFWTAVYILSAVFSQSPFSVFNLPPQVMYPILFASYITGVVAQNVRDRIHYTPAQAQQLKWVTFGLLVALFGFVMMAIPIFLPVLQEPNTFSFIYLLVGNLFGLVSMALIPLTIAFSMHHYRLWDVDIVINRSLVYGALTILLAAVFVGSVLLVQWVARQASGQDQVPLALAISVVIVGATFQPVRQRLQRFVDRRLYGIQVDYRRSQMPPGLLPGSLAGTNIGPYRVEESIGQGGMAEVYRGIHPTLGRPVAIKVLPPKLATEADFRARFEREAQTIAALRHPNIVQLFDFGVADSLHYMVMEYIAGEDLAARIRRCGVMSPHEAAGIARDIASALDYAHGQGIVHRDVKPSNVMIQPTTGTGLDERRERAILTDFGIAKLVTGSTGLTKTGMMGTLDYIAPEQIRASKEVDGRADLYALGVIIFQMLTGRLPFEGDNPGAVLLAHLQHPAPDPRATVADIPAGLSFVVRRALEKEPVLRYQTGAELIEAMEAALGRGS